MNTSIRLVLIKLVLLAAIATFATACGAGGTHGNVVPASALEAMKDKDERIEKLTAERDREKDRAEREKGRLAAVMDAAGESVNDSPELLPGPAEPQLGPDGRPVLASVMRQPAVDVTACGRRGPFVAYIDPTFPMGSIYRASLEDRTATTCQGTCALGRNRTKWAIALRITTSGGPPNAAVTVCGGTQIAAASIANRPAMGHYQIEEMISVVPSGEYFGIGPIFGNATLVAEAYVVQPGIPIQYFRSRVLLRETFPYKNFANGKFVDITFM